MTTDWRIAWVAALDAVEADVVQVEAMLVEEHRFRDTPSVDPWTAPPALGPLPAALVPRADAILTRQLAAARALALAMTANRRQVAFAAKVEAGDAGGITPSYLDFAV
jgi:hypothetical protein